MGKHKFAIGQRVLVSGRGEAIVKGLCHDGASVEWPCYAVSFGDSDTERHFAEIELAAPVAVGERVRVARWSRDAERGGPVGVVVRVLDRLSALVSFDGRERLLGMATLERVPTQAEQVATARRARELANGGDRKAARAAALADVWHCSVDGVDVAEALDRR